MTEEQQKDIEQLFEAMGNSGGRFVIGQVIGSQTNYIGDHLAQKDGKTLHEDIPHSEENVDDEDETILKNIIFNSKVFDTNEKLLRLRRVIAHSIDMGEYNAMFGEPNPSTIDPNVQGEWYYLMKALEESEVAKKFSVSSFIDQMINWYPWLFSFETPEDMQAFKRKMEKSISHEKSIWKYGLNSAAGPEKSPGEQADCALRRYPQPAERSQRMSLPYPLPLRRRLLR